VAAGGGSQNKVLEGERGNRASEPPQKGGKNDASNYNWGDPIPIKSKEGRKDSSFMKISLTVKKFTRDPAWNGLGSSVTKKRMGRSSLSRRRRGKRKNRKGKSV